MNPTLQWLILGGWTALGLTLMGTGALLHGRRARRHHGEHVAGVEQPTDTLIV